MPAGTKSRASDKNRGGVKGRNALKLEDDDEFEAHDTDMDEEEDDDVETSEPE